MACARPSSEREEGENEDGKCPSRMDELQSWLCGLITKNDYFTSPPLHNLEELQKVLYLAAVEIVQRLEPELEVYIHTAGEEEYSISLDEDDFYATREFDFEAIRRKGLAGVKNLDREQAVHLLVLARDEMEWLINEAKRLEIHCQNARNLRQMKLRSSFVYRPSPRKLRNSLSTHRSAAPMVGRPRQAKDETMVESAMEG